MRLTSATTHPRDFVAFTSPHRLPCLSMCLVSRPTVAQVTVTGHGFINFAPNCKFCHAQGDTCNPTACPNDAAALLIKAEYIGGPEPSLVCPLMSLEGCLSPQLKRNFYLLGPRTCRTGQNNLISENVFMAC